MFGYLLGLTPEGMSVNCVRIGDAGRFRGHKSTVNNNWIMLFIIYGVHGTWMEFSLFICNLFNNLLCLKEMHTLKGVAKSVNCHQAFWKQCWGALYIKLKVFGNMTN